MFSKLSNGLAGTWDSLDPQERILLLYGFACACAFLFTLAAQPARTARKQRESDALADLIAERVNRGR